MSARFNILSLSGGGFMGVYSAKVLSLLEELGSTLINSCS